MPVPRSLLCPTALLLVASCAPDDALETRTTFAALTGPSVVELTSAEHRYFGRLYFLKPNGEGGTSWYGCSATLVEQDTVLTAAHCAVCATEARMYFGNPGRGPYWTSTTFELHPDAISDPINCRLNPGGAGDDAGGPFDLAIVRLDTSVPTATAVGLSRSQVVGMPTGFSYMNQAVTHLGVGAPVPADFGVRRKGTATLISSNFSYYEDSPHGASFMPVTPRTVSAAEPGDSGGPLIWTGADGDHVVGIMSFIGPDDNDHYAPTYASGTAPWLAWRLSPPPHPISCAINQPCPSPPADADDDGIVDSRDNCPNAPNSFQQTWACP